MINTLLVLGAVQGFMLFILLVTRKPNRLANRLLGFFTLFLALECIDHLTHRYEFLSVYPHFTDLLSGLALAFGPLLYLYLKYLTQDFPAFQWRDLLHFVPLILLKGYELPFFMSSASNKLALINRPGFFEVSYSTSTIVLNELLFIQSIVYGLLAYLQYRKYKRTTVHPQLNWLGYVTILTLGQWVFLMVIFQVRLLFFPESSPFAYSSLLVVLFIYVISYKMLLQPEIIKDSLSHHLEKQKKQRTHQASRERQLGDLMHYMEVNKPYLDQQLNLDRLANLLSINRYYLSQLINESLGKNFSDFINEYRVKEARDILASEESDRFKLVAIAASAGFNSKTAFNTAFKKFTGTTPSEYRRGLKSALV